MHTHTSDPADPPNSMYSAPDRTSNSCGLHLVRMLTHRSMKASSSCAVSPGEAENALREGKGGGHVPYTHTLHKNTTAPTTLKENRPSLFESISNNTAMCEKRTGMS